MLATMRTWESPSSWGAVAAVVTGVSGGGAGLLPLAGTIGVVSGSRMSVAGAGLSGGGAGAGRSAIGVGVPRRTGGKTSALCERATSMGRDASRSSSWALRVRQSIFRFSSRACGEPGPDVQPDARKTAQRVVSAGDRTRAIPVPHVRIEQRAAYSRGREERKPKAAGESWQVGAGMGSGKRRGRPGGSPAYESAIDCLFGRRRARERRNRRDVRLEVGRGDNGHGRRAV